MLFRPAVPFTVIRICNAIAPGLVVTLSDDHGSVINREPKNISESTI